MSAHAMAPLEPEQEPEPAPRETWNVPKLAGRFPILVAEDVTVEELRLALNRAGMHLRASGDGWVVEHVHALALVKKDAE